MMVAVFVARRLPIMLSGGIGSKVMRRIAASMTDGMIAAPLLSMLVLPAVYFLLRRRQLSKRLGNIGF
jgi:Cu(I)/Ag(I) efflux system membrane protein CusA/SilA